MQNENQNRSSKCLSNLDNAQQKIKEYDILFAIGLQHLRKQQPKYI